MGRNGSKAKAAGLREVAKQTLGRPGDRREAGRQPERKHKRAAARWPA